MLCDDDNQRYDFDAPKGGASGAWHPKKNGSTCCGCILAISQ